MCLSLQDLTERQEGWVWLLGWGLEEGSLAQSCGYKASSCPGMSVGSQETHSCLASWEGWDGVEGAPKCGRSSAFSYGLRDGKVGTTRQSVASVEDNGVAMGFPQAPPGTVNPPQG